MTGTEVLTGMRVLLHDSGSKSWDDSEMIFGANLALSFYSTQLMIGGSYYYKTDSLSLVAGQNTYSIPSDCNGHIDFIRDANGNLLEPAFFRNMQAVTGSQPPDRFEVKHNTIYVYPTPATAETYTIGYWFNPQKITSATLDNEIDFPDNLAALLVYDGALFCASKHEIYTEDIEKLRNNWFENMQFYKGQRIHLQAYNAGVGLTETL